MDLASHSIVGFEALSRMTSPTLGRVSPPEFISIAERQEMIIPFGYWVLEAACQFIKRIGQQGHSQLYVAVNISVAQLLQKDFLRKVGEIVAKAGIDPHNLQLEITESVLIEDFDEIRAKLQPLQDLGLTIALDDFGTGYSALSRMGELPVDVIKIDKSFIDKILVQDNQRQIIQELIAMCHKLGLIVVAEGVEHEEQRQYLLEAGCDLMQGYLYSKPVIEELALQKLRSDPLRTDERT
ncbi:MAG: EAL domain-containing protein [Bacillota bacterium]|nr:EAL domain-containing protein [Bacillota bacterium]